MVAATEYAEILKPNSDQAAEDIWLVGVDHMHMQDGSVEQLLPRPWRSHSQWVWPASSTCNSPRWLHLDVGTVHKSKMGSMLKIKSPFALLRIGPDFWYEKVDEGQDGHDLDNQDAERELYEFRMAKLRKRWRLMMIISALNAAFLVIGLVTMGGIFLAITAVANGGGQENYYSPVSQSLDAKWKDMKRNGTVFPPKKLSFSRAEPHDPAAEARWTNFETTEFIAITRQDVFKLNADFTNAVRLPDEMFGLGTDRFVASLDSGHKMQCLNNLRKAAFAHYPATDGQQYFSGSNEDAAYRNDTYNDETWLRLRQCLDMLAQDIMCHADMDMITYKFKDMQPHPEPELSTTRKCRSWDQLMNWRDTHKLNEADKKKVLEELLHTSDSREALVKNERGWYKMHGFEGSLFYPFGNGFVE